VARVYSMLLPILLGAAPLAAKPGPLATLTPGHYVCERPVSAGLQPAATDAAASFEVTTSSRYIAADGTRGTYLLTGDTVEMTSGALGGTRLVRLRENFLRIIGSDGAPGQTRCVLGRGPVKP
jgi:hypothetical protein